MGNTAGQGTDRFKFLGLLKLGFEFGLFLLSSLALGDVTRYGENLDRFAVLVASKRRS